MLAQLALFALAPLAYALTLNPPQNPTSQGEVTITWTAVTADVPFSLFITNTIFHNAFAIANNVDPSLQTLTLELPVIPPGDGFTLIATNPGNMTDVFASTGDFSIGAATTTASSSSTSSSSGSSTGTSVAASTTVTTPVTTTTTSTSSFGVTVTSTSKTGTSSGTGSGTGSSTSSTSSASGAASSSASAALASRLSFNFNSGAFTAMILSAAAGAAVLAL